MHVCLHERESGLRRRELDLSPCGPCACTPFRRGKRESAGKTAEDEDEDEDEGEDEEWRKSLWYKKLTSLVTEQSAFGDSSPSACQAPPAAARVEPRLLRRMSLLKLPPQPFG
mmetsp:Transcript_63733/g.134274  ORF Transcript_63733/g.134274 Transcript_63733/m.134274 type:complete len:113 (-) Transcript_63733:1043-1381(-)